MAGINQHSSFSSMNFYAFDGADKVNEFITDCPVYFPCVYANRGETIILQSPMFHDKWKKHIIHQHDGEISFWRGQRMDAQLICLYETWKENQENNNE